MPDEQPSPTRVRVWDVPTRLVHWLIVIGVAISWWTGDSGRLEWHRWSGYGLLALVAFRLLGILRQLHRALPPVRARTTRRR